MSGSGDDPGASTSRRWLRARGRLGVPWYGRLESRMTLALVALGLFCVGATTYLVQLAVATFDEIGDAQEQSQREIIDLVQPFYGALAEAKREAFEARTRAVALEWEKAAPEDDEAWLLARTRGEADVLTARLRSADAEVVEVAGPAMDVGREEWIRVPVEAGAGEGAQLQLVFGVDPSLDQRFQRLGELQRAQGAVELGDEDATMVERREFGKAVYTAMWVASALVLLVAILAGLIIARQQTRKVSDMSTAVRRVAMGDLRARAPRLGNDELGQLAAAFNGMLDELDQARAKVEYLHRISAWQDMARRIAHEIKNPLTPIQLAVQQLREKDPGDDPAFSKLLAESVEIVEDEVEGLRRMVTGFSSFAKVPEVRREPIRLRRVLEEFERAYGHLGDHEEDELDVDVGPVDLEIDADRQLLKHVLVNLVENAVLSARDAGVSPVIVHVRAARERGMALIEVSDNGPGVPSDRKDLIFEPYETGRHDGTGLGLTIVKKIVLDHDGEVDVSTSDLGGACFAIRIPVVGAKS